MPKYIYPDYYFGSEIKITCKDWEHIEIDSNIKFSNESKAEIEKVINKYINMCELFSSSIRPGKVIGKICSVEDNLKNLKNDLYEIAGEKYAIIKFIKEEYSIDNTNTMFDLSRMDFDKFNNFYKNNTDLLNRRTTRHATFLLGEIERLHNNLDGIHDGLSIIINLIDNISALQNILKNVRDSLPTGDTGSSGDLSFSDYLSDLSSIFVNSGGCGINTERSKKFLVHIRDLIAVHLDELSEETPDETAYSDLAQRIRYHDGTGLVEKLKKSRRKKAP